MTKLLEKAFAQASELPEEEQDAFAAFLLSELESEQKWEGLFAASQDKLTDLASEALSEHRQGNTDRLRSEDL